MVQRRKMTASPLRPEKYRSPEVAKTLPTVYRHDESHLAFQGRYFGEAAHPSALSAPSAAESVTRALNEFLSLAL
jgi:hypothetical protein